MEIGVQFYTLREQATTLDDLALALKRVAEIGYKTVQISGVCPYEPEWLNKELKKNNLRCVLTHYNADEIKSSPLEVVKKHNIFDCNSIGIGCMPGGVSEENLVKFIEEFKKPAQIISENGSRLFYHNHQFEFSKCKDGELFLDKILNAFTPEELQITLDTFWVQYGGADVCDVVDKLKGRLHVVHLKDFAIVGSEQRMAPIGDGNLNFEKIIAHLDTSGAKYLMVEQDFTYGDDPFECLKKSYNYLKALGLN